MLTEETQPTLEIRPNYRLLHEQKLSAIQVRRSETESIDNAVNRILDAEERVSGLRPRVEYRPFSDQTKSRCGFQVEPQLLPSDAQRAAQIDVWAPQAPPGTKFTPFDFAKEVVCKPSTIWDQERIINYVYNCEQFLSVRQMLEARAAALCQIRGGEDVISNILWLRAMSLVEIRRQAVLVAVTPEPMGRDGDAWHFDLYDINDQLELIAGDFFIVPRPRAD